MVRTGLPQKKFESYFAEKARLRREADQLREKLRESTAAIAKLNEQLAESRSQSANATERWLRESRRNYELRKLIMAHNIPLGWPE